MSSVLARVNEAISLGTNASVTAENALDIATRAIDEIKFNYIDFGKKQMTTNQVVGIPIVYIDGDLTGISKSNKVNINYAYSETTKDKALCSGDATLKWQGGSSIAYPKKNYTIAKMSSPYDFGWGEQNKYCLKANYIDPLHIRNILSAKLWSQIVATHTTSPLVGKPNNGAMDGFPIMLVINDEFVGLYSLNIPKDQWAFGMSDDNDKEWLVTAEANYDATHFQGLCKRDSLDFAVEYAADGVEETTVFDSLDVMLQSVIDANDSEWQTSVAPYLDIDTFLDYFIFTLLTNNTDGIGKNYILSTYDATKWYINAYDLDTTFGNVWYGSGYNKAKTRTFKSTVNLNINRMFNLFYTYNKDQIKERYTVLRNDILSEDNIQWMIYNYIQQIPSCVYDADRKLWTHLPATSTDIAQITNFYRINCQILDKEVESW